MKISLQKCLARVFRATRSPWKPAGHTAAAAILAGATVFSGPVEAPAVELIENGGFEMNDGFDGDNVGFGWSNPDGPPVFDVYSHSTQVYYEGPAPAGAGDWYFHTVGVTNSEGISQEVDLTMAATAAQIDAGTVRYDASGWLAGWTASDDHPDVEFQFKDANGDSLGAPLVLDGGEFGPNSFFSTTASGADLSTFDNPFATWKLYEASRGVPVGARSAQITILQSFADTGNGNDNYTDLVSLDVEETGVLQFLKLEVNTTNGLVSMKNETTADVAINFYEIVSPEGSLSVSGWNSLDDQDADSVGSLPGESWTEGGGSDANHLLEAFLSGVSTLDAVSGTRSLGQAFSTTVGVEDLEFYYAGLDGLLQKGVVTYVAGISGDFDGNGSYDCADIDLLVSEIASGANDGAYDLTGDGVVDVADRDAWLVEAGAAQNASGNPYLLGDANLDGVVDVSDFNVWNSGKFTNGSGWCGGDFSADGVTDVSDFNIWNGNKFNSSDAASVPEPAFGCWMILVSALFACQRYRQER